MNNKNTKLIVVQSKVGNWLGTESYISNFKMNGDGGLEIIDIKSDIDNIYNNNRSELELKFAILMSRFRKQPLYHKMRSELLVDTASPVARHDIQVLADIVNYKRVQAAYLSSSGNALSYNIFNLDDASYIGGPEGVVSIGVTVPKEVSKAIVRFEAKVTTAPTVHDVWLLHGSERTILKQFVLSTTWKSYEVKLPHGVTGDIKLEVSQNNRWQYLGLRGADAIYEENIKPNEAKLSDTADAENDPKKSLCAAKPISSPSNLKSILPQTNLDPLESSYYFYSAVKELKRKTEARAQDFIFFLMPDPRTYVLLPAIRRLRCEGIKS